MGCDDLVEYIRCVCVWLGAALVERGGECMRGLCLGFTNPVGTRGVLGRVCVLVAGWCGWRRWGVGRGLGPGVWRG